MTPRLLTRTEAASYCRLTPEGFSAWVKQKIVPGAVRGTKRYDRHAIDAALDKRSGLRHETPESAAEEWLAEDHARQAQL